MAIYYQHPDQKDPCFGIYKQKSDNIQHFSVYGNLRNMLKNLSIDEVSTSTFLLDNQLFSFFKFDIFRTVDTPFTYQDLEEILATKRLNIKIQGGITAEYLMSYIDSIYINSQKSDTLIGKVGELFFSVYLVYIDDICLNTFRSYVPNILDTARLLPQSLYTMLFVRNTMQRENFALLYITQDAVKVVAVRGGFYDGVYTLNLGLQFLKKIYKDNNISQYRNQSEQEISSNSVAEDLISKSLKFYSEMLCKWLVEHGISNMDIFLISSVLKNGLFITIFNSVYQKGTNYIIPFHYSRVLDRFGKKRKPGEMDVLIYLNRKQFVSKSFLEEKDNFGTMTSGFTHHNLVS